MDVGQARGRVHHAAVVRAPQDEGVHAHHAVPQEQAEVRADGQGGEPHHEAAPGQDRRQVPHRPALPLRLHGRRPDREDQRELPPHLRRQGPLHRAQDHQPGGQVQAVPRQGRQDRPQERALPVHLRRAHHPVPRPRDQGQRLDPPRHQHQQDHGLHQV